MDLMPTEIKPQQTLNHYPSFLYFNTKEITKTKPNKISDLLTFKKINKNNKNVLFHKPIYIHQPRPSSLESFQFKKKKKIQRISVSQYRNIN